MLLKNLKFDIGEGVSQIIPASQGVSIDFLEEVIAANSDDSGVKSIRGEDLNGHSVSWTPIEGWASTLQGVATPPDLDQTTLGSVAGRRVRHKTTVLSKIPEMGFGTAHGMVSGRDEIYCSFATRGSGELKAIVPSSELMLLPERVIATVQVSDDNDPIKVDITEIIANLPPEALASISDGPLSFLPFTMPGEKYDEEATVKLADAVSEYFGMKAYLCFDRMEKKVSEKQVKDILENDHQVLVIFNRDLDTTKSFKVS